MGTETYTIIVTNNGLDTAHTFTINGKGSGAMDFLVTASSVSTSALAGAGQTAGRTPFSIALSACTPDSGNVHS